MALFPLYLARGKFRACEKENKVWLCVDVVNIPRKALNRSSLSIFSVIFPVLPEDLVLIFRYRLFSNNKVYIEYESFKKNNCNYSSSILIEKL